jgi:AraC-like DNA-binding protein
MLSIRHLESGPWYSSPRLIIRGIGLRETMPPCFIERPHGTGDYLFMMFHDPVAIGPAEATEKVAPPSIIFWSRTSPHFYGSVNHRWTHSWIHCDGSAVATILRRARTLRDRPLPLRDPALIDQYLAAIFDEMNSGPDAVDPVVVCNLIENLVRVGSVRRDSSARRVPESLASVKALIDARYEERFTLTKLAGLARLTPRHFCTEFRRHVGIAPITYLNTRRLHAAAALLRGTDKPVGTIGEHVGLADPYYFSKLFKKCFGMSPRHFRNSARHSPPD